MKKFQILSIVVIFLFSTSGLAHPWYQKMKIFGDFTYRHERFTGNSARERNRHRIRARLNLNVHMSENLDFFFGLASGGVSRVTVNQTLGDANDGAANKPIGIDTAYLDFKFKNSTILAGKIINPYFRPGGGQLIWDGDLTHDGIAYKFLKKIHSFTIFSNLGTGWWNEVAAGTDTISFSGQVGFTHHVGNNFSSTLSLGRHHFEGTKNHTPIASSANGNSTEQFGLYANAYVLNELGLEFIYQLSSNYPVLLFGNLSHNEGAFQNDQAYLFGMGIGQAQRSGTFSLQYNYRRIEKDGVIGALTDGDFLNGSTDGEGHQYTLQYRINNYLQIVGNYIANHRTFATPKAYEKYMFDIMANF